MRWYGRMLFRATYLTHLCIDYAFRQLDTHLDSYSVTLIENRTVNYL